MNCSGRSRHGVRGLRIRSDRTNSLVALVWRAREALAARRAESQASGGTRRDGRHSGGARLAERETVSEMICRALVCL